MINWAIQCMQGGGIHDVARGGEEVGSGCQGVSRLVHEGGRDRGDVTAHTHAYKPTCSVISFSLSVRRSLR